MKLIVVTSENIFEGEADLLNRLFERGMDVLHLRKPSASEDEIRKLLLQTDRKFHDRIVLHDRFALTGSFCLKGVHLNSRHPVRPQTPVSSLSRSCHSLGELVDIAGFDYVFLSPIFDSISKAGYTQAFTEEELLEAKAGELINDKVIALGGVHIENIPVAKGYGFGGVAVSGALWSDLPKDKKERTLMKRFYELLAIIHKQ
ncbi:MAG: thiamine phosphate synthase [Prevotella sp.]|jgi:thiamine-phosphate pyrophosphorylase|nr:thiamine phosphate synthase [Prevotella sp.]